MWDTNKIPRQGICTIYIGALVPLEYQKVPLLGLLLTWVWKLGQVSRRGGHPHSRREFSQKNREQERSDMGESVFLETDPISLFWCLLIYLLLHIGMNTESRGSQQSWPLSKSGVSHKCKKGTSSSGHEWDLLTFYDPFFLITKKLIFSKGVFS